MNNCVLLFTDSLYIKEKKNNVNLPIVNIPYNNSNVCKIKKGLPEV